jgi:heat shock protein HslJ
MAGGSMAAAGFRILSSALLCAACTSIAVDQRTFENTRWHVTDMDGTPTPSGPGFTMDFGRGAASAQFGCNRGSGSLAVSGDRMIPGRDWTVTAAACLSQERMQFEREGFDVLAKPMRISWLSATRVTLSNGAGSINLQRSR